MTKKERGITLVHFDILFEIYIFMQSKWSHNDNSHSDIPSMYSV